VIIIGPRYRDCDGVLTRWLMTDNASPMQNVTASFKGQAGGNEYDRTTHIQAPMQFRVRTTECATATIGGQPRATTFTSGFAVCLFAFGDGSVRPLGSGVSLDLLQKLCNPDNDEVVTIP
jgi:hypothetical protein